MALISTPGTFKLGCWIFVLISTPGTFKLGCCKFALISIPGTFKFGCWIFVFISTPGTFKLGFWTFNWIFGSIVPVGRFKFILELGHIISKFGFLTFIFWYFWGLSFAPTIIPVKINWFWPCKLVPGTVTPNPPFICGFGKLIFAFIPGCWISKFVCGIFIFGPFIFIPVWPKLVRLAFKFGLRPFIFISLFIFTLSNGFWIFKFVLICIFCPTLMPRFWISPFPSKPKLRLGLTSTLIFCPLKLNWAFNSGFSPIFISKFSWCFWLAFSLISLTSLLYFCSKSLFRFICSFSSWFWFSFSSWFFTSSFSSFKFSSFSFSFGWFKLNLTPILIGEKSWLFFSSFSFSSNFFFE